MGEGTAAKQQPKAVCSVGQLRALRMGAHGLILTGNNRGERSSWRHFFFNLQRIQERVNAPLSSLYASLSFIPS